LEIPRSPCFKEHVTIQLNIFVKAQSLAFFVLKVEERF
jgi:hypothetical protein